MKFSDRLVLFARDLNALIQSSSTMLIFNHIADEDTYVQISHVQGEPLLVEVSNKSEGWGSHSLDHAQVEKLRTLGYEIPSPHHQSNPHKEYDGSAEELAREVETIFREVFRLADDYAVESSGVFDA